MDTVIDVWKGFDKQTMAQVRAVPCRPPAELLSLCLSHLLLNAPACLLPKLPLN